LAVTFGPWLEDLDGPEALDRTEEEGEELEYYLIELE
jgi:hypothetical protein